MTPHAVPTMSPSRAYGVSFPRVVRSEWIKLRSLRSSAWSYAIQLFITIGIAFLMASAYVPPDHPLSTAEQAKFIASSSTFGIIFGQIVAAVLGVLIISAEYTTGTIRTTLTAVPRRLLVLWAKAVVVFSASFTVGLASCLGAFTVTQLFLAGKRVGASLADPAIFLPLLAASFYLGMVSVFALGVGAAIRNSAGGMPAVLGLLILPSILTLILPFLSLDAVMPYVMINAGYATFGLNSLAGPSPLETWQQFSVVAGWVAVAFAAGAVVLKRRDA